MNIKSRKIKALAKDTGLFAISSFGSKLLIFFLTPFYTAILSTKEYGIADLIITTMLFIYPVFTLAIEDATLRFSIDSNTNKKTVINNSIFIIFISLILLFIGYPLICKIDVSLQKYWYYFFIIYFLFNVDSCFSNFVKGIGKTKLFALKGIVHTFAFIFFNILFLAVFKLSLKGYLLSIALGYFFSVLFLVFSSKLYRYFFSFKIDKKLMREMLTYSIPMVPALIAWMINTSIDKYMIIWMVNIESSGIYSIAHKIPTIFTTVLNIFSQAWQISAISNHGDSDESEYYSVVYKYLNIISVIGCLIIILLCKWISKILFANSYYEGWRFVPMLMISAMFSSHSGFLAAAFRAEKKTNSILISVLIGSLFNVLLNYYLIKLIGVIGAAISTAISFFVVWVIRFYMAQRIVKIKVNWITSISSYALLVISSIFVTSEFKYSSVVTLISILIVVVMYWKSIVKAFFSISKNIK